MMISKKIGYLFLFMAVAFIAGCNSRNIHADYIILRVDRSWSFRNLTEYLFNRWVYVVSPDGSEKRLALPRGLLSNPEWSPNGEWVVCDESFEKAYAGGRSQIYLIREDGSQRRRLSSDENTSYYRPTWFSDGLHVAYSHSEKLNQNSDDSEKIFTSVIDIQDVSCLLHSGFCQPPQNKLVLKHKIYDFDISPDDRQIVYAAQSSYDGASAKYRPDGGIFIIDIERPDRPRQIAPDQNVYCHQARWSLDGQRITFGCSGVIYVVNKDGGSTALNRGVSINSFLYTLSGGADV